MLFVSLFCRTRYTRPKDGPTNTTPAVTPIDIRGQAPTTRRLALGAVVAVLAIVGLSVGSVLTTTAGHAAAAWPTGQGLVLNAPIVGAAITPTGNGYWEVGADGGIFTLGDARFYGSAAGLPLSKPIVAMAATPDGRGYWEVASDGGVFAFGDAGFYGSTGRLGISRPVVGIEPTPDGRGYWEVAADGGVFAFGDAGFYGSAAGLTPDSPIVGLAAAPDGRGYWEAAADGAVFTFGRAAYSGDAPFEQTVAISSGGTGYRLLTANGDVLTFGGAAFDGSLRGVALNKPMIGLSSTRDGYLAVAADGGIFTFGTAGFYGSLAGATLRESASTDPAPAPDGITLTQVAEWERVNICEEGGAWNVDGSEFSGGLGFTRANWDEFNTFGYPADAADATPLEQIRVAVAFATAYWGSPDAAPDQDGCRGY